ncbi:hypothetical protein [Streptomyces sp. NPDC055709]
MPGYGFSGKPTASGWDPRRMATAWGELMKRLRYTQYVASGGDWRAIVTEQMGLQEPEGLIGFHTNMANAVPPDIMAAVEGGRPLPADVHLSLEENEAVEQLRSAYADVPYAYEMGTAPQTLAGLVDSPVGLAAFMLDHDWQSLEMIARSFAGEPEGLTRDDVLDNITLFWLTRTPVSAARLYWENTQAGISFFGAKGVQLPVAVGVFPTEMYRPPRSWAEIGKSSRATKAPATSSPAPPADGPAKTSPSKRNASTGRTPDSRYPVERTIARIKTWRVLRKARLSPNTLTSVTKAILTLETHR